jgi:hypothetical protein
MAQIGIRALLAVHLQAPPSSWQKENFKGSPGSYFPDSCGKSDVGRAAHSRGASHVGIRCFRVNHLPLDEPSAARSGASQALARIFAESPRSHCGDGLLHSSNPVPTKKSVLVEAVEFVTLR